jgi:hypothetical protein
MPASSLRALFAALGHINHVIKGVMMRSIKYKQLTVVLTLSVLGGCANLTNSGRMVETTENKMLLKGVCTCLAYVEGYGGGDDFSEAMVKANIRLRNAAGELGATNVMILDKEKSFLLGGGSLGGAALKCIGDDYPPKIVPCS